MARFESEQRAEILEAALNLFAQKGWKGATTRMLGREAGVNSALLYYYFENKHTLFEACIRHVLEGFLAHLSRRLTKFASARERVRFLVEGAFDYFTAHPNRMQLIFLAINMHEQLFASALNSFLQDHVLVPLNVLIEGMKNGDLRRMNPIQTWWCVLGMCMLSLHMHKVMRHIDRRLAPVPLPSLEETKKQIADILESGVALSGSRVPGIRRKQK